MVTVATVTAITYYSSKVEEQDIEMELPLPSDLADMCSQQLDLSIPENELDDILSQLSEAELSLSLDAAVPRQASPTPNVVNSASVLNPSQPNLQRIEKRFAAPKSDADVQRAKDSAVPKSTAKNTSWSVNVWREWRSHRFQACGYCTDYNQEQHYQCRKCLCTCNRTGQHSSIPLQWVLIHHSQHHQVTVISSLPFVTMYIYLLYCCCKRCYLYY